MLHSELHGFDASSTKKTQGEFVKPGKKDLEKQWENFFVHQRSGSRLFSCESVWARAGADGEWLRVGAVVTKSDDVSNADAVAAQKKLISWSATQLFPALNAKKGQAPELGLGPYVDDEKDDDGDASKVAPVGKGDKGCTTLRRRLQTDPLAARRAPRRPWSDAAEQVRGQGARRNSRAPPPRRRRPVPRRTRRGCNLGRHSLKQGTSGEPRQPRRPELLGRRARRFRRLDAETSDQRRTTRRSGGRATSARSQASMAPIKSSLSE